MKTDIFISVMYVAFSFLAHILAIVGLFQLNDSLGIAAILYEAATWFKAWGDKRLRDEQSELLR
jgi:hypothetical protein